ncbi:MAG: 2-succinyl-6-hydroxy-2,4-cyclohexadiene-1-carboxylate synthase [Calditrichaeota bacterium]|nr:2-succinyl-6-hydroxy-2,4-cyclohexadiene-1-carboxylate synthase [Calditrichota bacterium]HQU72762.1 2-succinyl-6-hydroxy-2,4-cyclohexadiene-1-carboxylate synthase [Calditrichia bacterium]
MSRGGLAGGEELSWQTLRREGNAPTLFLHGFMGRGEDWLVLCENLTLPGPFLLPDLPGHGETRISPGGDWTFPAVSRMLLDYLDRAYPHGKVALCGYSMGGRLALYLALTFPERFSRLCLISASPGLAEASERSRRRSSDEKLSRQLLEPPLTTFLKSWYAMPLFSDLAEHPGFSEMLARRAENDPSALAKSLREMGTGRQPSLWRPLSALKIPVLLVVGEKDAKFQAIAEEMSGAMEKAEMAVIADTGHNPVFEAPENLAGVLQVFFQPASA